MSRLDEITRELVDKGFYDRFIPLQRQEESKTSMKTILESIVLTICLLSFLGGLFLIIRVLFDAIEKFLKKQKDKGN